MFIKAAVFACVCSVPVLAQTCAPHWIGHSLSGQVSAVYFDAAEQHLLVGGEFPGYIAAFAGGSFATVGSGLDGQVLGITRHDDGSGSKLYVTGFVNVPFPGSWTVCYARLESGIFRSYGPNSGPGSWTGPAVSYNLGAGPKLLTSGGFGSPCSYVAQWGGTEWECLGDGLDSVVTDACIYDDGSGPALFCVGSLFIHGFPTIDGEGVAKWNGAEWTAIGGLNGSGQCCIVHDDGSGPELFVGGQFTAVGNPRVAASNIAKYNGHRWAPLGAGLNRWVRAMAPFDDGSGGKLYVAGDFTASGAAGLQRLARWDGAAFTPCPAGGLSNGTINSLVAADIDGPGPQPTRLYVGGAFSSLGAGVSADNFAVLEPAPSADFNHDGVRDFFDYLDFVASFASGSRDADFNGDGSQDLFDYLDFVDVFAGC